MKSTINLKCDKISAQNPKTAEKSAINDDLSSYLNRCCYYRNRCCYYYNRYCYYRNSSCNYAFSGCFGGFLQLKAGLIA